LAACIISGYVPSYVHDLPSERAMLASAQLGAEASRPLNVASDSFADDALLDERYSDYAADTSPSLSWPPIANAKSYALIVEDSDTKSDEADVHWLAWNIPANVTSLREGRPKQASLTEPNGMRQGDISHGLIGYHGPIPSVGDAPHHYHFQVFALDTPLGLPGGAKRNELLDAIKGHVIAQGKIVARYARHAAP